MLVFVQGTAVQHLRSAAGLDQHHENPYYSIPSGLRRLDILIQPPLGHIRFLDFGRAAEIIEIGYESVRGKIDVIQKKLQEL